MLAWLVACAASARAPHLETVAEFKGHLSYDALADPRSGNVAWTNVEGPGVYLYRREPRKVSLLGPGWIDREQNDCGAGLVSVISGSAKPGSDRTAVFRLDDGAKLTELPGRLSRCGRLFVRNPITDLSGRTVFSIGHSGSAYLVTLVWDGKRRLALVGKGDRPNDVKDVVELSPEWKKGKRAWLSDYAMGFAGIVGNPDVGTFAISEASNRSKLTTGIFTRDLKRIGGGSVLVTDVGPHGVLAWKLKFEEGLNDLVTDGAVCLDATTGKVKWQGKHPGRWFGKDALDGGALVSGKNGKTLGEIQMPKDLHQILASFNDTMVLQLVRPNRIRVCRIRR